MNPNYYSGYASASPAAAPQRTKSVGAIVIYIISGALALMCLLVTAFPSIYYDLTDENLLSTQEKQVGSHSADEINEKKREEISNKLEYYQNIYLYIADNYDNVYNGKNLKTSSDSKLAVESSYYIERALALTSLVFLPTIFLIVGAILSFARVRAAGGIMLAGSILYTVMSSVWLLFLYNLIPMVRAYFLNYTSNVGDYLADTTDYVTIVPALMVMMGISVIVMSVIQISKRDQV